MVTLMLSAALAAPPSSTFTVDFPLATEPDSSAKDPEGGSAAPERVPAPARGYGGLVLLIDAASLTSLGLQQAFITHPAGTAMGVFGAGGYLLGSPILHFAKHRPGAAIGSFLLRSLLPAGGGLLGYALGAATCECALGGALEAGVGAGIGLGLAITLDVAVLARRTF
jgi:hypothetical protein